MHWFNLPEVRLQAYDYSCLNFHSMHFFKERAFLVLYRADVASSCAIECPEQTASWSFLTKLSIPYAEYYRAKQPQEIFWLKFQDKLSFKKIWKIVFSISSEPLDDCVGACLCSPPTILYSEEQRDTSLPNSQRRTRNRCLINVCWIEFGKGSLPAKLSFYSP